MKKGQESAFPLDADIISMCGEKPNPFGISKRFYAACVAMQGLLANSYWAQTNANGINPKGLVKNSYEIADELLSQEDTIEILKQEEL